MMFSKVSHESSKVCKTFSPKDNFPTAKKNEGNHCKHDHGKQREHIATNFRHYAKNLLLERGAPI